ncbi:hypothetical protein F5Y04DRAFT_179907 [Hypomontagnella monticulosa]|nr:hypothetical protein F5Y04DRAFT_179907 [Hypomontagnella monticulosa]
MSIQTANLPQWISTLSLATASLLQICNALFAPELIAAYPDAKVVLNVRRDVDAWYRSFESTMGVFDENPVNLDWVSSWFCRDLFWIRQCMNCTKIPLFFRGSFAKNGKEVYRDHVELVRNTGLSPDRFLEWSAEDGWEPLCEFPGKPIPQEPFPSGNTPDVYNKRLAAIMMGYYATASEYTVSGWR